MAILILLLGICAFTTQAATYKDAKLHRMVRSPHYGGHYHVHPPFFPPPPPFAYQTHNWSGVGRDSDGGVEKVFSSAAAAAQSNVPALNGAFSLAETSASGSADCEDDSHSSGVKSTEQYKDSTNHVGQSDNNSNGSFNAGSSGFNSHANVKETSSFSQLDQNSASNGFGPETGGSNGGQASGFNSGYGKHSGGYGGYRKNFKESHYFVQNGGGNGFGSQAGSSETNQGSHGESGQSSSGVLNIPQAQESTSNSNDNFGANSQGFAQSGSSGFGSGYNSDRYQHGRGNKFNAQGSNSDSVQGTFSENGQSSSVALNHQGSSSGTNGNYGEFSHGPAQSGSSTYGSNQGSFSGSEQSSFGELKKHQALGSSSSSNGNFGGFSRESTQSGSSASASGSYNDHFGGRGFGSSNFQADKSETLTSQQLKSTEGSEQSGGYQAGSSLGQTAGNGYGQHESALHGALELAGQGLQAANNAKCSTCQKSSYALSNAKSYNGAAIALSIGG